MNIIHNQNVAFRCPNTLKQKLQTFAEDNQLRVSAVIRNACIDYLRKEQAISAPHQTTWNGYVR